MVTPENEEEEAPPAAHAAVPGMFQPPPDVSEEDPSLPSGTLSIEIGEVAFKDLRDYIERTFRPVAEKKRLALRIDLELLSPVALSR